MIRILSSITAIATSLACMSSASAQQQKPIEVLQSGNFAISGSGTDSGRAIVNLKEFDPRLGTLDWSRVSFQSTHRSSTTFSRSYEPGPMYSATHTVTLNTSTNYGGQDVSDTITSTADCNGTVGCLGGTNPLTWRPGSSVLTFAQPEKFGGPIRVLAASEFAGITAVATGGSWSVAGTVNLDQQYTPFSTKRYLQDAIKTSGGSDLTRANNGYSGIIELRETSSETASQNLNLRDAEYYLRGFAGGEANVVNKIDVSSFGAFFNDVANRTGPVATSMYNGLKAIRSVFDSTPIAGEGEHPNTPVGGWGINLKGWIDGLSPTKSLDESVNDLGNTTVAPPVKTDSYDLLAALAPDLSINTDGGNVSVFHSFSSILGDIAYFDPVVAKYLTFGVDGNAFTGIQIMLDDGAEQELWLAVDGTRRQFTTGEYISFADISPGGVKGFYIEGFENFHPEGRHFIFGATFADIGEKMISVIASDFDASNSGQVPEPGTVGLFLIAGYALLASRRRNRHSEY